MGSNRKAARSRGDIMKRLDELEAEIDHLKTARRLPNSSYASGGPRTRGGRFLAEDLNSEKVFEVTTEPPDIFMRPELISAVAAQVFADRISTDVVTMSGGFPAGYTTSDWISTLETGLGADTPGPELTVNIDSGRALVFMGAHISNNAGDALGMSYAVSGATTITEGILPRVIRMAVIGSLTLTTTTVVDLNNGSNTFTAFYQNQTASGGLFSSRIFVVIPF